jgi:serine/threonine-protein kinase
MADSNIGKTLAGKYRVDSLIESDGLADLYGGVNLAIEHEVIVKIVKPDLTDKKQVIFDEARKVSRSTHPGLLAVTDLGEDNGTLFAVYEYFDGESLTTAMSRDGQFPVDRAVNVIRQVAPALAAVNTVDPIHGVLRPENILVAKEKRRRSLPSRS